MERVRDNGRAMPGGYHVGVCHLDLRYCLENAERFGETLGDCYAGYPMRSEMAALMATSALSVVSGTMEMAAVNDWSEADARRA